MRRLDSTKENLTGNNQVLQEQRRSARGTQPTGHQEKQQDHFLFFSKRTLP